MFPESFVCHQDELENARVSHSNAESLAKQFTETQTRLEDSIRRLGNTLEALNNGGRALQDFKRSVESAMSGSDAEKQGEYVALKQGYDAKVAALAEASEQYRVYCEQLNSDYERRLEDAKKRVSENRDAATALQADISTLSAVVDAAEAECRKMNAGIRASADSVFKILS
jgi:chromosome segregation ATPase